MRSFSACYRKELSANELGRKLLFCRLFLRFLSLQIATYGLQNTTFWMTLNETPIVEEHSGAHQKIHGSSLHLVQILEVAEVVEIVQVLMQQANINSHPATQHHGEALRPTRLSESASRFKKPYLFR